MNENEARKQLAVFDSLLNDLATAAANSKAPSATFFAQVGKVVTSIIDPNYFAIVAAGPRRSIVPIYSGTGSAEDIGTWVDVAMARNDASAGELKPKNGKVHVNSIDLANRTWGWLITVSQEESFSPVYQEIIAAISQILTEFLVTRQLADQTALRNKFQQFSINVHSSLIPAEVAQHIANDARLLMNCERVSVYAGLRERPKLLAVSAVAAVESRSDLMKRQNRLVAAAAKLNQPIGSDQPPAEKGLRSLLHSYQDQAGFPFLFGIPLETGNGKAGYLLAESTNELNRLEFAQGLSLVIPPASIALANALRYQSIPFRNFLAGFGGAAGRLKLNRIWMGLAFLILATVALTLVKTDFKVRIQGELRPVQERVVFAPRDGIVSKVMVRHGDQVQTGQLLLQLHSPEMELAMTRNVGEFEKLAKLLDAKNIALNQASSDPNASPSIIGQLSSEVSDIEYQISSLADEKKYLLEQQNELRVNSPIAGNVISWKVEELLMNKPVRWGDALLNVANEAGDWQLRFLVPERRIGYILAAQAADRGVELEFFFESNPQIRFASRISEIGKSTERDSDLGPVAVVFCPAPDQDYVRRHGARVIADVNCGRKSIGFVWTHELIDSLRRRFVW